MGDYKVAYLLKNRSAYGDFIVVGRCYHENATKNFLKHFVFDRTIFSQDPYFPKIMFIYKIKANTNIINQDIQKEDVYLPDFFSKQLGHHIGKFLFSLPNSSTLKSLLAPLGNLSNEINPETINPKDIFKIPQENLVKTVIENYIKTLTVSFVNESYFLNDKSNDIEQTFITELNKLISVYSSIIYFDKKSMNEAVEISLF